MTVYCDCICQAKDQKKKKYESGPFILCAVFHMNLDITFSHILFFTCYIVEKYVLLDAASDLLSYRRILSKCSLDFPIWRWVNNSRKLICWNYSIWFCDSCFCPQDGSSMFCWSADGTHQPSLRLLNTSDGLLLGPICSILLKTTFPQPVAQTNHDRSWEKAHPGAVFTHHISNIIGQKEN